MRAAVSPLVPKPRKAGAAIWSAGRIHTRLRAPPVSLCFPFFLLLAQTVHVVESAGFVIYHIDTEQEVNTEDLVVIPFKTLKVIECGGVV